MTSEGGGGGGGLWVISEKNIYCRMIYREKLSCKEIPGENSYNEKKKTSLMAYNAGKNLNHCMSGKTVACSPTLYFLLALQIVERMHESKNCGDLFIARKKNVCRPRQ